MKLLYVCSDYGIQPAGTKGASIHLRAITRGLSDAGHTVALLTPHAGPGGDHPSVPISLETSAASDDGVDRLRHWMKSRDLPTAVCGEIRSLQYNASIAHAALSAVRRDRPDAVVERLSLFSFVGADLARSLRVPHIVEVNAVLSREASQFRDLQMGGLAREMERRVLCEADAVIVVSEALAVLLAEMGVDRGRIHVVPNGADVERYDPGDDGRALRASLELGAGLVIGFAGSLKSWHGVDVLLSAFSRVREEIDGAKLLIVGTGPMESRLREQAQEAGVAASVVFTGAIEHRDVPAHLAAMDIAVAPFRSMEGFYFSPIKLFEYMAAGRCVVASRLGQIEDIVSDGENGVLCDPDDEAALAEVLSSCGVDAAYRGRLAASGRACVVENYTWRRTAERTVGVIEAALAKRSRVKQADGNVSCETVAGTE